MKKEVPESKKFQFLIWTIFGIIFLCGLILATTVISNSGISTDGNMTVGNTTTGNLFVNGTLGVGNSTPIDKFQVQDGQTTFVFGTLVATYGGIAMGDSVGGSVNTGNYQFGANGMVNTLINSGQTINLRLNNADKLFLNATGIGIGTSNPMSKLDVNGTVSITGTNSSLSFSSTILPVCGTATNHTLAVNGTGLYYCNTSAVWALIVTG